MKKFILALLVTTVLSFFTNAHAFEWQEQVHNRSVIFLELLDDERLISGDSAGRLVISNIETGEKLSEFDTHTANGLYRYLLSPDKSKLISSRGSFPGSIDVWSLENRERIGTLKHTDRITKFIFSPRSDYVATASDDGTARILRLIPPAVNEDTILSEVEIPAAPVNDFVHPSPIQDIRFIQHLDGLLLVVTPKFGNTVKLIEINAGAISLGTIVHDTNVTHASRAFVDPTERFLITATRDDTGEDQEHVVITNLSEQSRKDIFHNMNISDVQFSPDGRCAAILWDENRDLNPELQAKRRFFGHASLVNLHALRETYVLLYHRTDIIRFSPDSRHISFKGPNTISFLDISNEESPSTLQLRGSYDVTIGDETSQPTFSQDGLVAYPSIDKEGHLVIAVTDLEQGSTQHTTPFSEGTRLNNMEWLNGKLVVSTTLRRVRDRYQVNIFTRESIGSGEVLSAPSHQFLEAVSPNEQFAIYKSLNGAGAQLVNLDAGTSQSIDLPNKLADARFTSDSSSVIMSDISGHIQMLKTD